MTNRQKPLLLRILNDTGIRIKNDYNPFTLAKTPSSDSYFQSQPPVELNYVALQIGLPSIQMDSLKAVRSHKWPIAL